MIIALLEKFSLIEKLFHLFKKVKSFCRVLASRTLMDVKNVHLCCHIWVPISITSHPRSKLYGSAGQGEWLSCMLRGRIDCIQNLRENLKPRP